MTDPRLALVFDDGYVEDYTQVYPVLDERDVPASVAAVPSDLDGPDTLSVAQLSELADAGWEVAAHGRRHRYLQAHSLAADASAGDRSLTLDGDHVFPGEDHGVLPGDRFEVTDGARSETRVLAGTGDAASGSSLTFETALAADFDADETVVRPAESTLRDEVVGANEDLRDLGFDPTTFVLPYDAGDARAWRVVAEHYDALANAAARSLPNPPGASPLDLRRYYLQTDHMRTVEIETYLDLVAERDGLGVLAGHSAWASVTPERVGRVVDAARERGIDVTTVRAAVQEWS